MKNSKLKRGLLALGLLVPLVAYAGSIKSWSPGNVLRSSDLNANFSHIHSSLRGYGHTLITNADIDNNAAISPTKIAPSTLMPKVVGLVEGTTVSGGSGISSVSSGSAGNYSVTLSVAPPNDNFMVFVQSHTNNVYCSTVSHQVAAPQFVVRCNAGPGNDTNTNFSVLMFY